MGKKSKKTKAATTQKKMTKQAATDDLRSFLDSVEIKPSRIHGNGLFATRNIQKGVYRTSNPAFMPQISTIVSKANSVSLPPWRQLLESAGLLEDESIVVNSFDDVDDTKRALLKEGWVNYVEQGQPNMECVMYKTGTGAGVAVTVPETIERGEEILRNYAYEWLAMEYFDLVRHAQKCPTIEHQKNATAWLDMENLQLILSPLDRETFIAYNNSHDKIDMVQMGSVEFTVIADCLEYLVDQFRHENHQLETCWNCNRFIYAVNNPSSATGNNRAQDFGSLCEGILDSLG